MSGTSADAIDAVLAEFSPHPVLVASHSYTLPASLKQEIHALSRPGHNEIERAFDLDAALGELFAKSVGELLSKTEINPRDILAIGSHGQTIRHRPATAEKPGFSWQIGDPNIIAERTGITTVADFRRRDIAAGGQGAPLVPAFHHAIFHSTDRDRVVLNIGGISNITWLPAQGSVIGFDTGPGNTLMDAWIQRHKGLPFDRNGDWAATGNKSSALLEKLLDDSYFSLPAPKSSGPERFNLAWLDKILHEPAFSTLSPEDIQATLLDLTVQSVASSIRPYAPDEVYVCGGGYRNTQLMKRLQIALPESIPGSTADLGVDPEWAEALAFAWLAKQTIEGKPGNMEAVTGAERKCVLGGIYPGCY